MGLACRVLDDHDAAEIELEAARSVFEELGARPAATAYAYEHQLV